MNRGHRLKDMAWGEFESVDIQENGKTVKKRKCNHCSNLVSNKIERVRAHLEKCDRYNYKPIAIGQGESSSDDGDVEMATAISSAPAPAVPLDQRRSTTPYRCRSRSPVAVSVEPRSVTSPLTSIRSFRTPTGPTPSSSGPSSPASTPENTVRIRKQLKLDSFVISTPPKVKAALDLQFARAFFSCNIPFSAAEDPEMKKLFTMMRGGSYQPPSRRQLSEGLLNEVAGECELHMVELLKGKQVTMVQDGWSNVHNHPIIATCLHLPTSGDGGKKSIFAGSIDTGAEKKTAKYISDLAIKQIGQFEHKYKCKVVAYISDNENKMKLTRQLLQTHFQDLDASDEAHEGRLREHNLGLLVYGCAAHYFNLVEKDGYSEDSP